VHRPDREIALLRMSSPPPRPLPSPLRGDYNLQPASQRRACAAEVWSPSRAWGNG
jgi:hypothetical protein